MKQCPICQQQFDDSEDFCPDDTTLLVTLAIAPEAAMTDTHPMGESSTPQDDDTPGFPPQEPVDDTWQAPLNSSIYPSATTGESESPYQPPTPQDDDTAGFPPQEPIDGTWQTPPDSHLPTSTTPAGQASTEGLGSVPPPPFGTASTATGSGTATPTETRPEPSLAERIEEMLKNQGSKQSNQLQLPEELLAQGWQISGTPVTKHGIDVWPVQRPGANAQLCVYASGVLTYVPSYEHLLEHPHDIYARLYAFGTLNRGHGVTASYELVEASDATTLLNSWLANSSASEERALSLLPGLSGLLRACIASGVLPITLDPNIVQRSSDGRLRITRLGGLWMPADIHSSATVYRADFERSPLLPVPWGAPEIKARQSLAPQSLVFSIGQLLASALFGQPPSLDDIRTGVIPFKAIQNPVLARLLMGSLYPQAEERWSLAQMLEGLEANSAEAMPEAPAWSKLMPGAAKTAFAFAGQRFFRLEDLLAHCKQPEHWDEAIRRLGEVLIWTDGTAWKGLAAQMREVLHRGEHSADWVLVYLTNQICPDLPRTWRDLDFSDLHAEASLVKLAQQALDDTPPDFSQLRQLYEADLRGAFSGQETS